MFAHIAEMYYLCSGVRRNPVVEQLVGRHYWLYYVIETFFLKSVNKFGGYKYYVYICTR